MLGIPGGFSHNIPKKLQEIPLETPRFLEILEIFLDDFLAKTSEAISEVILWVIPGYMPKIIPRRLKNPLLFSDEKKKYEKFVKEPRK